MNKIAGGFNLHLSSLKIIKQHRRLFLLSIASGAVYFLLFLAG
jgi:hypothetical protein